MKTFILKENISLFPDKLYNILNTDICYEFSIATISMMVSLFGPLFSDVLSNRCMLLSLTSLHAWPLSNTTLLCCSQHKYHCYLRRKIRWNKWKQYLNVSKSVKLTFRTEERCGEGPVTWTDLLPFLFPSSALRYAPWRSQDFREKNLRAANSARIDQISLVRIRL